MPSVCPVGKLPPTKANIRTWHVLATDRHTHQSALPRFACHNSNLMPGTPFKMHTKHQCSGGTAALHGRACHETQDPQLGKLGYKLGH